MIKESQLKIHYNQLLGKSRNHVYAGEFIPLHQEVAVKQILLSDLDQVLQILNEVISLAFGQNHPNIVKFYGFSYKRQLNEQNDQTKSIIINLVFEKATHSLEDEISSKNIHYEFEEFVSVIIQIVQGLQYLEEKGLAHRDLKPGNILLTKNRKIKITDVGEARYTFMNQISSLYASTPGYRSPELKMAIAQEQDNIDQNIDFIKCDVYALAIIMLRMIHLKGSNVINSQVREKALQAESKVGKQISDLILEMIDENPLKRPSYDYIISKLKHSLKLSPLIQNQIIEKLITFHYESDEIEQKNYRITIYEASNLSILQKYKLNGKINDIGLSLSQLCLFVCYRQDHCIQKLTINKLQIESLLFGHNDQVTNLTVQDKLNYLFSASQDKTIRIWDTLTCVCLKIYEHKYISQNEYPLLVANYKLIFSLGIKRCTVWSKDNSNEPISYFEPQISLDQQLKSVQPMQRMCWIEKKKSVALCFMDKGIRLLNLQNDQLVEIGEFSYQNEVIKAIAYQDQKELIIGSSQKCILIWKLNDFQKCMRILIENNNLIEISKYNRNYLILSKEKQNKLMLLSLQENKISKKISLNWNFPLQKLYIYDNI